MSTKYELVNVLDASYIKDKTAREHLQTIAKYGYWGTKEGIGSLAEVKKLVDPKYQGAINDGIALAVTQAALWKYGNQDPNLEFGGNNINGDEGGGTYKTEELLEEMKSLALEPEVIIMDEATSALDVSVQKTIIELITKLQREKNITIGFICHDIALIEQCAHQIAVMYLGNVVEVLPGGQLSKDAVHPYTRALMGSVFDINMDFSKSIENLEGEAPSPLELPEGCPFQGRCTKCMAICKKEAPQMVSLTPDHQVACHLYTESVQK